MVIVQVESTRIMRSLNRLEALTKKPMETLVRHSARRVCVNLSRTIAPFGFDESAKTMGERAVIGDYGLSTIVRNKDYLQTVIDITGSTRNINQVLRTKNGVPYLVDWQEISFTPSRITKHHNSRRSKVTGRIGGGGSARGSEDKQIGRWRANNQIVTDRETKAKGMQKALKRVGLAKHAYALAAKSLGGTRGIPGWVKKSRGKNGAGSATLKRSRSGYTVEIDNHLPYASRILSTHGEMSSMKREADYLMREVDAKISGAWKK